MALAQGEYTMATGHFEEALDLSQFTGDTRYVVGMQNNLGMAALGRGDHRQARTRGQAGLALARQLGLRRVMGISLDLLASAAAGQGESIRAARLFGAAEALPTGSASTAIAVARTRSRLSMELPPWIREFVLSPLRYGRAARSVASRRSL